MLTLIVMVGVACITMHKHDASLKMQLSMPAVVYLMIGGILGTVLVLVVIITCIIVGRIKWAKKTKIDL